MPRKLDDVSLALAKYLEDHGAENLSESEIANLMQRFMVDYNAGRLPATSSRPLTADDYLDMMDGAETDKERLKHAKKALDADPDNLDAAREVIALTSKTTYESVVRLSALMEQGSRQMEDGGYFTDCMGDFWLEVETRPYMRLCKDYADALRECGMMKKAAAEYERMLELCNDDNLGVRYDLLNIYAALEDGDGARALAEQFEDDTTTSMLLPLTILYFKLGQIEDAEKSLTLLVQRNRDFKRFLRIVASGDEEKLQTQMEGLSPYGYRPNTMDEIMLCVFNNADVFTLNAGFFEWADVYLKAAKKMDAAKKRAEQPAKAKKGASTTRGKK